MVALSVFLGLVAAVLLLPTLSDLSSLVRIALGRRPRVRPPPAQPPKILFLVPAHDEELLIESCLRSLSTLDYPRARYDVTVIADNCTDGTATLARAAGAQCLERDDPTHPGKPRAIAWALPQLATHQYDGVVIIDADATVDQGFALALATANPLRDKVLQPYNDVHNRGDNALSRMAAVFAAVTYRISFRLKRRAGLNVPVSAGMCIGAGVLAAHPWNAFSLSEDWELYAWLTAAGVPIDYVEPAHLYAQEARSLRQSASQRQRWTAGKLAVLRTTYPTLVRSRRIGVGQKLDALAELSAPGPAVHLGVVAVLSMLAWLQHLSGGPIVSLALWASLLRPVVHTLLALGSDPEPWRALGAFAFLPIYTVWRLGTLVASLRMIGDKPWVRTERHAPTSSANGGSGI